jgi:hypothetical protein
MYKKTPAQLMCTFLLIFFVPAQSTNIGLLMYISSKQSTCTTRKIRRKKYTYRSEFHVKKYC